MKKIILFLFILTAGLSKVKAQSSTIAWQYTTAATQYSDAVISKPHASGVFVAAELNFDIKCYLLSPNGSLCGHKYLIMVRPNELLMLKLKLQQVIFTF